MKKHFRNLMNKNYIFHYNKNEYFTNNINNDDFTISHSLVILFRVERKSRDI